jgi:glutamine synthetase
MQSVTGDYPAIWEELNPLDVDMVLQPDPYTIRLLPWAREPSAQVIHDCYDMQGKPIEFSPRQVLRRVLEFYRAEGWKPVVAPELEFYLLQPNLDPRNPLLPPIGRTGRAERSGQSYNIDSVNDFDPMFDDMYDFCEGQGLEIDTLIHEEGMGQMEINLLHGDAVLRHFHGQADGGPAGQRDAHPSEHRGSGIGREYIIDARRHAQRVAVKPYRRPAALPARGHGADDAIR